MILLSATLLGVVRHDPRERVVLPERVVLAASSGALQTLDLELSWDPRLAFAHDAEGYQLLHHAADKVRPEICRLLLARGADVDARTADTGLTPLIFAVNRLDIDKRGRQAIDYARENGHRDLAAFLDKGDSASYSTWFLTAAVLAASFAAARLPLAAAAPALAWCARLVALRTARDAGAAVATEARSSGPAATSSHTSSSSSHAAASHAPAAESSSAAAGVGCLAHESAPAPEATLPLEATPPAAAAHAVPLQQQQDEKQAASLQAVPPGAAADALQQPECIVCWDAPATHIFVPCGHQCVCERCGAKLERCPKCRVVPTAMMRVFH
ncbi:hypothetical protein EMIHUDRAFT_456810 [Emiliania huxleyi CCMP1516]|uniref:RING-type domain-containing protein n=2 Tax=Emiliania huxleyi TaxID=2903 RepID=A0A0D3K028_EMIH1|nr:hypothetical protein EMIHUDRAFT_456810 [Emiliania huxleyi CCMP1516]EOD29113.1 hypothetical protein EMIHUDRAFT_456810 [Emiliania huxleyi CCMP1516]|eukprot:XP_005781542.1 hypothetical protein EMIHUDRAFT_456810 [Emiliania huxleyi CCMP1516]